MYFLRAKEGIKSSTTEALRRFYERDKYKYLNHPQTIVHLRQLAEFWQDVLNQDSERFDTATLKCLFVLNYAPNGMWHHLVSAWFLANQDEQGMLNNASFTRFLNKIIGFIYTYAITNPGVNALRTPAYEELINIVNNKEVTFARYRFDKEKTRNAFENYVFTNQRNATRSLLTWYAFSFEEQQLLGLNEGYQIEHIYAKKRFELDKDLSHANILESLGNKILLETSINIRASDYRFEDKRRIYSGEQRRGNNKDKSKIYEINELSAELSFTEENIKAREKQLFEKYFIFLQAENLLS